MTEIDRPPLAHRIEHTDAPGEARQYLAVRRVDLDQAVPGKLGDERCDRVEGRALGDEQHPGGAVVDSRPQTLEKDFRADPSRVALGEGEVRPPA